MLDWIRCGPWFKPRLSRGARRLAERQMARDEWEDAGQGWQGIGAELRLQGWSRSRRVVVLRRRLPTTLALTRGDARQTRHAGQTVTSHHGRRQAGAAALRRIAGFFRVLARSAEQLSAEDRWRRILAEALRKYLHGREPGRQPWLPPPRTAPAC